LPRGGNLDRYSELGEQLSKRGDFPSFQTAGDPGPVFRGIYFLTIVVLISALMTWLEVPIVLPFLVGLVAIAYATTPVWYLAKEHGLAVKQGIWTSETIRYDTIERTRIIEAPQNFTKSVSGVEIQYKNRVRRAVPKDVTGFIDELARRCPHLHRYGSELRPGSIAGEDQWKEPPKPARPIR